MTVGLPVQVLAMGARVGVRVLLFAVPGLLSKEKPVSDEWHLAPIRKRIRKRGQDPYISRILSAFSDRGLRFVKKLNLVRMGSCLSCLAV